MTCILPRENLIILANVITTSNISHHYPSNLGVFTNTQVTMLSLQENLLRTNLASIFETFQTVISRAISNVLDVVLLPPLQPKDLPFNGYIMY